MPRASAEQRAADAYRENAAPPPPPDSLTKEGKTLWAQIVRAKPPAWFDAGSLPLLELYCATIAEAKLVVAEIQACDVTKLAGQCEKSKLRDQLARMNTSSAMLATKLRLSVQAAVDRRNRVLNEKGPEEAADDRLIGGKGWPRLHAVS